MGDIATKSRVSQSKNCREVGVTTPYVVRHVGGQASYVKHDAVRQRHSGNVVGANRGRRTGPYAPIQGESQESARR
jgi:hypothetical protein